jgi:hypothetical protein
MSVEAANGRMDCGTQGFPTASRRAAAANAYRRTPKPTQPPCGPSGCVSQPDPSPDRVKGVRIFDISDIHNPKQVVDVQTCRGSHTHTLVVDPKDKDNVYIYVSGSAGVRPTQELGGCRRQILTKIRIRRSLPSSSSRCRLRILNWPRSSTARIFVRS